MDEEIFAMLAELRQATDQVKETMDAFATVGSHWVETINTMLKWQDLLGLVQIYRDNCEEPYGLEGPFLRYL